MGSQKWAYVLDVTAGGTGTGHNDWLLFVAVGNTVSIGGCTAQYCCIRRRKSMYGEAMK